MRLWLILLIVLPITVTCRATIPDPLPLPDHPVAHDITSLRLLIAQEPAWAEAHYNLAVLLHRQGNLTEAETHYLEAATLAPGNPIIWDSPPLVAHGSLAPSSHALCEGSQCPSCPSSTDARWHSETSGPNR